MWKTLQRVMIIITIIIIIIIIIDKTQQNNECRWYGDRDETIIHMISECGKLTRKEYKSRHDWTRKVIHWELCKKLKFDDSNKWYMYNTEFVRENQTYKLHWDFEIRTDHLISTTRPDLEIVNQKQKQKQKKPKKKTKTKTQENRTC